VARRRIRKRRRSRLRWAVPAIIVLAAVYWLATAYIAPPDRTEPSRLAAANRPTLVTDREEIGPIDRAGHAEVPERGSDSVDPDPTVHAPTDAVQGHALLQSGTQALAHGDALLARAHFGEALNLGLSEADAIEARRQLRKLSHETLFSPVTLKDDPFAETYVIQPGDTLLKIAKSYDVTAELLARINHVADVNRIRAGQRIKIIRGPFHARVDKAGHTMDVFLGDTFVEHFKVGLGAENSTPPGRWVVRNKLTNPTYYPPRGGDIMSADDPENPLGERWIGLEGVAGGAVGQMRYGIHGTIEPESIGRSASLGCIRLFNEDVEFLFDLVVVGKSFVDVVE